MDSIRSYYKVIGLSYKIWIVKVRMKLLRQYQTSIH